jgi:hypothetical protein
MAVHASHAALPYAIKGARFSFLLPYLDSSGTPTAPTTPDTEFSLDNGAAADCAEEVSATSGMDGIALMTVTGAETNGSTLALQAKVASGPKATLLVIPIANLAAVGSGTLSAGSAGGGTLGTLLAYDVTGCFIKTTGGTGGGGTGGANNQARKIATYNTSTGAFTVVPNWETTPDATTTYDVLLPEGVTLGMLRTLNPTTAGRTLDVSSGGEAGLDWANIGSPTTAVNLSGTSTKALEPTTAGRTLAVGTDNTAQADLAKWIGTAPLALSSQQVQAVVPSSTVVASVTGAVGSVTGNVGGNVVGSVASVTAAVTVGTINANVITATSIAADAITAAKVADGTIDTATFAAGTTLPRVTLVDTLTTYTGNTPQTGDSFARIGATGSGLTSLAPSATALSTAQWTNARATALDNLDAAVTSRMATYTQPTGFLAATFPATVASTTNITGGTITTVTNLTNAPTAGDFTATMKTSLNAATPASVVGNVGGIAGTTQTLDALQTALNTAHGAGSWATATSVTVSDKTGFKLASDGLDSIATTAPAGVASNFREMLVQVWRRFFRKSTLTATQLKTYADDGTTVVTTQTVSDDGTTQTQGTAT